MTEMDGGMIVLLIARDVTWMFPVIIKDRKEPKVEQSIDVYSGFFSAIVSNIKADERNSKYTLECWAEEREKRCHKKFSR